MKKILAFGASNSQHSINRKFAEYTANQLENTEVKLLDLNDFEMPIYSIDRENTNGFPEPAHRFRKLIADADGIIISFAEHNGSYTAAYKNLYDWTSRIAKDVWQNKAMLLLSTSPGGNGASLVLEAAFQRYSRQNSNTILTFSLPSFKSNFDPDNGIKQDNLRKNYTSLLEQFKTSI